MAAKFSAAFSRWLIVMGSAVAALLVWRVLAVGLGAALPADPAPSAAAAEQGGRNNGPPATESQWRERLARNPTDVEALLMLARAAEQRGDRAQAAAAVEQALKLDPAGAPVLLEAARLHLRAGDAARALPIFQSAVDLYPRLGTQVWPVFTAELGAAPGEAFLAGTARANPRWWPDFFARACIDAKDAAALARLFELRLQAGTLADSERRCMIERMQRDGRWADARDLWARTLPPAKRAGLPKLFNGSFEWPLSNLGFDWIVPPQRGATVEAVAVDGAQGKHALRVAFGNQRYGGPPVLQYMLLQPGRYRLAGRARAVELDAWMRPQWALYCHAGAGAAPRPLARTEPLVGNADAAWGAFGVEFSLPAGCPVQVLQLELVNPRADADAPGTVPAPLRGVLWFDDLQVNGIE